MARSTYLTFDSVKKALGLAITDVDQITGDDSDNMIKAVKLFHHLCDKEWSDVVRDEGGELPTFPTWMEEVEVGQRPSFLHLAERQPRLLRVKLYRNTRFLSNKFAVHFPTEDKDIIIPLNPRNPTESVDEDKKMGLDIRVNENADGLDRKLGRLFQGSTQSNVTKVVVTNVWQEKTQISVLRQLVYEWVRSETNERKLRYVLHYLTYSKEGLNNDVEDDNEAGLDEIVQEEVNGVVVEDNIGAQEDTREDNGGLDGEGEYPREYRSDEDVGAEEGNGDEMDEEVEGGVDKEVEYPGDRSVGDEIDGRIEEQEQAGELETETNALPLSLQKKRKKEKNKKRKKKNALPLSPRKKRKKEKNKKGKKKKKKSKRGMIEDDEEGCVV